MSSNMFDDDDYNPVEPFSQDEFVAHNDRELLNLDAGRSEYDEDYDDVVCPRCGSAVRNPVNAGTAYCRSCGTKF